VKAIESRWKIPRECGTLGHKGSPWEFFVGFVVDIDPTNNILRVTMQGHVTDSVALSCARTVGRCAAAYPGYRGIVDLSKVTKYDVSPEVIRQLARTPPTVSAEAYALVIVAPKEHPYGMSRMFQLLTETTRPNQHVVRTMDEAFELLQVKSPTFVPVDLSKMS
jgi:hypothetical protein